jgi:flagella basal body P-ring formation protein FlgA
MDIFEIGDDYLENLAEVDQMALTANVDTGEHLKKGVFKITPTVKKGDVIKLVARKKRLSIVTLGICREDGYANQPIMVENMKSGKLVRGLVKKDATVEVVF